MEALEYTFDSSIQYYKLFHPLNIGSHFIQQRRKVEFRRPVHIYRSLPPPVVLSECTHLRQNGNDARDEETIVRVVLADQLLHGSQDNGLAMVHHVWLS